VEHLNITNRAYLPRLSEAIRILREKNLVSHGSFRPDWNARLLEYWLEPPSRPALAHGSGVSTCQPARSRSRAQRVPIDRPGA
jgi:hypothetical protein